MSMPSFRRSMLFAAGLALLTESAAGALLNIGVTATGINSFTYLGAQIDTVEITPLPAKVGSARPRISRSPP